MPGTTWNPSDKTGAGLTLTGGNLIATTSDVGSHGVRAVHRKTTGKYYWEVTSNVATGAASGPGIAASSFTLGLAFTSSSGARYCGITHTSGQIYSDGVYTNISLGTPANGTVICIAFDCDTRRIWFRLGAAGNWNNSASANPATGIGGILTSLGGAVAFYPYVGIGAAIGDQFTANFGDSAFTGAVPAGFTSGVPTDTAATTTTVIQLAGEEWSVPDAYLQAVQMAVEEWSVPNAEAWLSQLAAEHWINFNAEAQLSQFAAEVWGGVGAGPNLTLLSQLALEMWAEAAPPLPTDARLSQIAIEEWANTGPTFEGTRVSGLIRETLLAMGPTRSRALISALARETLLTVTPTDSRVRAASMARETLLAMLPLESRVRIGGLVRETLISPAPPRQYAVPQIS